MQHAAVWEPEQALPELWSAAYLSEVERCLTSQIVMIFFGFLQSVHTQRE